VFQSQKKLGAIAQNQVDIVAMKLDDQIRSFKVRGALIAGLERKGEVKIRIGNDLPQKFLNPGTGFLDRIFRLQFFFPPSLMIIAPFVAPVAPRGSGDAVLLKNHCCPTPTKLLAK